MSLRCLSRMWLNAGARAMQSVKDQGSRLDSAGFKSMQPGTKQGNQARRFSGAADSAKWVSSEEKRRRREAEKAETIHHLICWGPK